MDELIEAMAIVLDEELSGSGYTQRDTKTGHVNLFDGDLDTPEISKNVLDKLHERGWHFSKGATCPS